jgi:isocitrate dehydrogenase kinase/phosphatase
VETRSAAALAANLIAREFDAYHHRFRALTRRAKQRFELRDWRGIRRNTVERLNLHGRSIADCFDLLRTELGPRLEQKELWVALKQTYAHALLGRDDFELGQTFFNSLVRRVFPHAGVDPSIDYADDDFPLPYRGLEMASARTYAVREVEETVIQKILENTGFAVPFHDLELDVRAATERIRRGLTQTFGDTKLEALDILRPVFMRNKAAYVVGRARRGNAVMPLMLSILHRDAGLELDAVLHTGEEVSVVFSFARWYFHAEVDNPRAVIGFLHSILPRKRIAELYISLGYNKHGKTEFYRDLMGAIAATDQRFVVAPGKPGLVMSVFTLPTYEFVFKVIRDCFPAPKSVTPEEVREKYSQVLHHDRVGRLVDFQEFEHLEFPRERFSPELLEELLRSASSTVEEVGDNVVIHHLYVGRRVTPLDLYLRAASPEKAAAALIEWGHCLKDLAAANVFAGDMLLKNFGVTRHGRVVFYDYDDLSPLTDCEFRRIPPARSELDEMAAEPWFSVGQNDVFPEELRSFLSIGPDLLEVFNNRHADLFEVGFWRRMQERNRHGEIIDFFPYEESRRLRRPPSGRDTAAGS